MLPPDSLGGPSRHEHAAVRERPVAETATALRGTAASPWVVIDRARVVVSLEQADRVSSGDIVVCRATAPPWGPLLAIANGIVANSGGALSHTAIVARELGISCVVGVTAATEQINDGDLLRVDGTAGEVRILEPASPESA